MGLGGLLEWQLAPDDGPQHPGFERGHQRGVNCASRPASWTTGSSP